MITDRDRLREFLDAIEVPLTIRQSLHPSGKPQWEVTIDAQQDITPVSAAAAEHKFALVYDGTTIAVEDAKNVPPQEEPIADPFAGEETQ